MTTFAGIDLGDVTDESSRKSSQLFQQAIPKSDSSSLIALDIFGVERTISIKGRKTGTEADIKAFIVAMDALVNGNQVPQNYTSIKSGATYKVVIQNFNWDGVIAGVTYVDYSLDLLECANVS